MYCGKDPLPAGVGGMAPVSSIAFYLRLPKKSDRCQSLGNIKKKSGRKFFQKSQKNEFSTIYNKILYMKMLKVLNPKNKVERPVKLIITENQFRSLISKINEQPLKQLKK
jgi:hypothetical protein